MKKEKHDWKEHWKGMPEFVQEDLMPFKQLIINFQSEEDVQTFAELVEQKITNKTKSIWFPKVEKYQRTKDRYSAEVEE